MDTRNDDNHAEKSDEKSVDEGVVAKMNKLEAFALILLRKVFGDAVAITIQSDLLGRPDFYIGEPLKIAIFVDGDFWHSQATGGQRMRRSALKFAAAGEDEKAQFWAEKADTNQARDRAVNKGLREVGVCVVRLKERRLTSGMNPLGYVSKSIAMALFNHRKTQDIKGKRRAQKAK